MSQHHHDLVVLGGSPDIKVPAAHEGPRRRVPDDEDWACCPTWILLETDGASSDKGFLGPGVMEMAGTEKCCWRPNNVF